MSGCGCPLEVNALEYSLAIELNEWHKAGQIDPSQIDEIAASYLGAWDQELAKARREFDEEQRLLDELAKRRG